MSVNLLAVMFFVLMRICCLVSLLFKPLRLFYKYRDIEMNNDLAVKMNEAESLAFIQTCCNETIPVLEGIKSISPVSRTLSFSLPDKEALNKAVLNSTMIAFPEGMKRRHKTIIKRTFLFADISAQVKYPKKQDAALRLAYMQRGLNAMGWAHFGKPEINEGAVSSGVTMANLVVDIAKAALGGIGVGTVGQVLKTGADAAIKGLEGKPEALKIYEKNGNKSDGSNFGVMSAAESADDDIYLTVGAISYGLQSGNTHIAFFDKTSSSFNLVQGHGVFTMYADEDYTAKKEAECNRFYEAIDAALEMEYGF